MTQRIIKFRIFYGGVMHHWGITPTDGDATFVPPIDLLAPQMQFTGLHDKNGREIYEGDVVRYRYDYKGNDHWEVAFGYDGWVMRRGERETGDDNAADDPHTNNWRECEVIGNIYEHPHLLK